MGKESEDQQEKAKCLGGKADAANSQLGLYISIIYYQTRLCMYAFIGLYENDYLHKATRSKLNSDILRGGGWVKYTNCQH